MTQTAFTFLGLAPDTRIRTFNQDARQFFIEHEPLAKYDVVYGDAFNDVSIPYHLTTREFAEQVRRVLAPGGVYVANVIDLYPSGDFLPSYVATLREVFAHIGVLTDPKPPYVAGLQSSERATFVVASAEPFDLAHIRIGVPFDVSGVKGSAAAGTPLVLTDDYAPVDRLTAPRFLERTP